MTALRVGSLFSGIGGLDLAVEAFFDAETVWHCEFDPEPSKVLAARWPGVPNLGDVTTVDWSTVEPADILCGGFPCQDLSLAGRRSGMRPGTRSGLWADFKTAIAALKPKVVVIENVRGLLSGCAESDSDVEPCPGCVGVSNVHRPLVRALGRVLGDLAGLGFDAEWGALEASAVGAPHGRFRVFVVAYAQGVRFERGWPARHRWVGSADGYFGEPVALLPTPMANEAEKAGNHPRTSPGQKYLTHIVHEHLLPTPTTNGRPNRSDSAGAAIRYPIQHIEKPLPTPRDARGNVTFTEGGNNAPEESRPGEVLPSLWDEAGAEAIRGATRGPDAVSVSPDLLAGVREHEGASAGGDAPLASPKVPRTGMRRMLHHDSAAGRAPHRQEPGEQRPIEPSDALRELSPEEALAGRPELRETRVEWGAYEAAVHRWEAILGRDAPNPTRPDGKNGQHRLNPEFCSWMMGYPDGWVTDILARNPAIKACGNGVCSQQAYAALGGLWARVLESLERAA